MLKIQGLTYDQKPTGVIYGFLRQIQSLAEMFQYPNFIFTWDSDRSFRRQVYPEYKRKPNSKFNPEMEELLKIGKGQFRSLRYSVLPRLGYRNVFGQSGIEADDIIAIIIRDNWDRLSSIVIVSADNDLYQLLQPGVVIYDPFKKEVYNEDDFKKEKKIDPSDWSWVKAIAGCNSDNVKGVKGVAEISVIKYLKGELTGKKEKDIIDFCSLPSNLNLNLSLVQLPHKNTLPIQLKEDELNIVEFERVCLDFGFHSLLSKEMYNKWKKILSKENK